MLVQLLFFLYGFEKATSYPESGLHVSLAKQQTAYTKQWTPIKGWATNNLIGSFMQDFRIVTTSHFIIPRSGLYFVSLHLFFGNNINSCHVNVSINNDRTYISKYNTSRSRKDLHIYETVQADIENILSIHILLDSQNVLLTQTSISMQFLSSLETSIGFISSPVTRTINRNKKSQPFIYWIPKFNLVQGFSQSTGRYTVLYDGYYVVTLKLVVKNIVGSLKLSYVYNSREFVIIEKYYPKKRILYDTFFYTNIEKLNKLDDIYLRIFTTQRGGTIQSDSMYSVVYLRQPSSDDVNFEKYIRGGEIIRKNFDWHRIVNWLPDQRVLNTIQINANGYYFVTVRVDVKTFSSNDIYVQLLINNNLKNTVTETGFIGTHRIVVTAIYFMKMQDGLNCQIKSKLGDQILSSSFYTITKVKFVNQTALFSIKKPLKIMTDLEKPNSKISSIQKDLKLTFGNGTVLETNEISNTIFSIVRKPSRKFMEIKKHGHYFITLNILVKNESLSQSNLFILHGRSSNWKQVARLYLTSPQSLYYTFILTLQAGDILALFENDLMPLCQTCIDASLEVLLLQIMPNSIGASLVYKEVQSTKNKIIDSYKKTTGVQAEYDCVTIENDKLKIDKAGVYLIVVNLKMNLTDPDKIKNVRLNLGLNFAGQTRASTIYEAKKAALDDQITFYINLVYPIIKDQLLNVKITYQEGRPYTEKQVEGNISVLLLHTNDSAILIRQADVTNEIQSSAMISWKTKFSEIFYYFSVMIDIRVQHTMLALLATTVNGKITVNRPGKHVLKASIQVNKKPIYHLTTVYENITTSQDVSLSISGLVTLQQEDYVYVHISLTDGLTLRLSKQTRIFIAVLDETFEEGRNFTDIETKILDLPSNQVTEKDFLIKESGVYQIEFTFKGGNSVSRRRRSISTQPISLENTSTATGIATQNSLTYITDNFTTAIPNQVRNGTTTNINTTSIPASPIKSANNKTRTDRYTPGRYSRSVGQSSSFSFTTTSSLFTSTPITRPKKIRRNIVIYQADRSVLNDKNIEKLHNKINTIWSSAIFNFSCIYCIQKIRILAYLEKGKTLRSSASRYNLGVTKMIGDDNSFTTTKLATDLYLCGMEKRYDYITWSNGTKNNVNYFYQAGSYGINYVYGNFIVDDPLQESSLWLVVNSNMASKTKLRRTTLSSNQSLHQIAYKSYTKYNGLLQIMVQCPNTTIKVLSGGISSVYPILGLLHDFTDNLPTYQVQPFPLFNEYPKRINYTCELMKPELNDYIDWKRVEIYSGEESTAAKGSVISFDGIPEESGHYFCRLDYMGVTVESNAITFQISDDDECLLMLLANNTKIKKCDNNSECVNTIGSYYCTCDKGYTGDGFTCNDINECLTNPCGNFSKCINTPGDYRCECIDGYRGYEGLNCTDIDECDENGPDFCPNELKSDKARCRNFPGKYECYCIEGFQKKGGTCKDVDECESDPEEYPCHSKASCFNTEGSFYCRCDTGWFGNGTHCEDVNECANKTLFQCAGNATCNNNDGSYRCICKRGFKGDGKKKCAPLGCFPPAWCSGQYSASWWARKPYIENGTKQDEAYGLFRDIISIIITDVCNNCSQLVFNPPLNDSTAVELTVEENVTDIACPLYGSKEQEKFRGFPFIPIVEAPGVAFFVKELQRENNPLIGSLAGSWPILVITLLLASLSGVIIWFLDTVRNPKEFPHSFLEGSWEGFWWAFITMTTVGYGDKAPRSFFARVFGILWILIGLVIISTFTATITTVLTASSLSNTVKLYGTKVGALANSEEFRLGVKRNADVIGYRTVTEIINALNAGEIQGALLDTYIAGEFQDSLSNYKLQEILEHVFVYGLTLARDAENLEEKFRSYMERKQSSVYAIISKVVKPLKENKATKESGGSTATLFDANSPFFVKMLVGGCVILLALLFIGFLWDWFYWRNKTRSMQKILNGTVPEAVHVSWQTCDIIEYQKRSFRKEVSDMKSQITTFTDLWLTKLNELEVKHEQQLSKVQKWLGKSNVLNTIRHYPATNSTFGNFGEKEQKTDFLKLYQNDKDEI